MSASEHPAPNAPRPRPPEEAVPLFGTWPRIHGAVVVAALLVMGLLALFSRWPF
jgi:hypothetical protein